ncbi:MAG: hypothetical protein HY652_11830 [Acidobacteria bacterium]|nr:hypothetical protein [Acidobacteriota bacterium]
MTRFRVAACFRPGIFAFWPGALWLIFGLSHAPARARTAQEEERVKVEIGSSEAVSGTRTQVALLLFLPEKAPRIQKIVEKICFSDQFVRFVELEPGPAARAAEAHIEKKLEPGQACRRLTLEFAFEKPPVSGTLARLSFQVDPTAPVDHTVSLVPECQVIGPDGSIPVSAREGTIKVVEVSPIFACFFYMH